MKQFFFFCTMSIILSGKAFSQELRHLLPDSLPGWKTVTEDKQYGPQNLYDYIDGGAELYLSYEMQTVVCRIYSSDDQEIRVEIFDMLKPENAFGVFSHTRDKDEMQFGQGSQYFTGALIFWKGPYYITLTANDDNPSIRSALESVATQIDNKIHETGELPEILSLLPKQQLLIDKTIYFHHYIWLNAHYYIGDDNFLNINHNTPSVLAQYGDKEHKMHLLLINYPDKEQAAVAYKNFMERFLDNPNNSVCKIEDGTWVSTKLTDKLLICVFNAANAQDALALIESIHQ